MLVFWFIVVVSVFNLFLFCVWNGKTVLNVFLKMYFFTAVVSGAYILVTVSPQDMLESVEIAKQP